MLPQAWERLQWKIWKKRKKSNFTLLGRMGSKSGFILPKAEDLESMQL